MLTRWTVFGEHSKRLCILKPTSSYAAIAIGPYGLDHLRRHGPHGALGRPTVLTALRLSRLELCRKVERRSQFGSMPELPTPLVQTSGQTMKCLGSHRVAYGPSHG